MITINIGDTVEATCRFNYSGTVGSFTFALEIGTWIPPIFNTLKRWETRNISISPGTNQEKKIRFTVGDISGLHPGKTYDMNWEIGTGSQVTNNWELIIREITDDVIAIAAEVGLFENLSVSYKKI